MITMSVSTDLYFTLHFLHDLVNDLLPNRGSMLRAIIVYSQDDRIKKKKTIHDLINEIALQYYSTYYKYCRPRDLMNRWVATWVTKQLL